METLHDAIEATERNAKKLGYAIEIPMITGGISYGETRNFHLEITNKRTRKMWQVIITRLDNGKYELVNYAL